MARITFEEACKRYVHRYTMEHIPRWAFSRPVDHGGTEPRWYAPHYRTDREWYDNTLFPGDPGHIDHDGRGCLSTGQTWPLGSWLTQPMVQP